MQGFDDYTEYLSKLGKHRTRKGGLYINKLSDIDIAVLEQWVAKAYLDMKNQHS